MSDKWSVFLPSVSSQNAKVWNPSSPYPRGLSGRKTHQTQSLEPGRDSCSISDLLRDPDFFKGFI